MVNGEWETLSTTARSPKRCYPPKQGASFLKLRIKEKRNAEKA